MESPNQEGRGERDLVQGLLRAHQLPRVGLIIKSSRDNSSLDNTSDFLNCKKRKKQPSGSQSSAQTSTAVPTHVNFKCVTININRFSEEKWKYILSLPIIQSVSVIILTEHHLSGTFRPKELIDSGWNIRAVATGLNVVYAWNPPWRETS